MKLFAMAAAALVPLAPGAPAPDDFCAGVEALAAGAAETVPFRTLRERQTQFRMGRLFCFFTNAGGYRCAHNLARPNETRESYATRVSACLPGAMRVTERLGDFELITVRRGSLEARFDERGEDRGHVGRTVSIFFAAVR